MNRRLVIIMGLAIASIGSCSETGKVRCVSGGRATGKAQKAAGDRPSLN